MAERREQVMSDWAQAADYRGGQETRFKKDLITQIRKVWNPESTVFRIETEETEPGFPDLLMCNAIRKNYYMLLEVKVSDSRGVITFQPAQLRFYRRHPSLNSMGVAWDVPEKQCVGINPAFLDMEGCRYHIKSGREQYD
jgi:hypothetical protein